MIFTMSTTVIELLFGDTLFPVCLALTIPFGGDLHVILQFADSFDVVKYGMIQVLYIREDFYLRYFSTCKSIKNKCFET